MSRASRGSLSESVSASVLRFAISSLIYFWDSAILWFKACFVGDFLGDFCRGDSWIVPRRLIPCRCVAVALLSFLIGDYPLSSEIRSKVGSPPDNTLLIIPIPSLELTDPLWRNRLPPPSGDIIRSVVFICVLVRSELCDPNEPAKVAR